MNDRKSQLIAGALVVIASLVLAVARTGAQQAPEAGKAPDLVWPNKESKANSDDWLRLHHNEIRQMQPRVLVLNFVNGLSSAEATQKVNRLIAAVKESSRYHGYKNASAPAFLDYQLYKLVDLTDPQELPEDARLDGNSSKYPRVPDWKEGLNFRYDALFSDDFAHLYQVADPENPAHFLTLSEMVNKGIIHEVWFLALQGKYGAPLDSVEVKQAYDRTLHKIPGRAVHAGAGRAEDQPFIGRSLRILFINAERGPGVAMESLGRSLEGTCNSKAIPYFTRYFTEYAGFDLKQRYHLPFDSLYGRDGNEFDYPDKDTMVFTWKGEKLAVHPYIPVGGNVRFMPTARRDNDLDNGEVVLSTIEHYRLRDALDGNDKAEEWYAGKFSKYRQLANDSQGPWMVYWRQNMPGLDNMCKDDDGKPMLNWWPFLFY
jgi:hypothetical protein